MLRDGLALRYRIFDALRAKLANTAGYLPRAELESFRIDGHHLPLLDGQQAIHNPTNPIELHATLSVYTKPGSKYDDGDPASGVWRYGYTGDYGLGGRNKKLRRACELNLPIIYYDWIAPGLFAPLFPVWVVRDVPEQRHVLLAIDELQALTEPDNDSIIERKYRQAVTQQRLHQRKFRAKVLHSYQEQCTVCRFKHVELLDAAHITADSDAAGDAEVTNGLAMCKIHHAAYDRNFLGITPNYTIKINEALLQEVDGPILKHGLQEMHDIQITLPKRRTERPDRDRLEARFVRFSSR